MKTDAPGQAMEPIRVGVVTIPFPTADAWIQEYTDPKGKNSTSPYAYPAYDFLDTASAPDEVNDGDLLAPVLLNVRPTASAFYRLQAIKSPLAVSLSHRALGEDLASLSDAQIRDAIRPVYAILDNERAEFGRRGLSGTTLSKVVHRKRPKALCLHDKWVEKCYVGDGRPVPQSKGRSWADYMVLLSIAMREDLTRDQEQFKQLRSSVLGEPVSDLRLLDILAWRSKGTSQ